MPTRLLLTYSWSFCPGREGWAGSCAGESADPFECPVTVCPGTDCTASLLPAPCNTTDALHLTDSYLHFRPHLQHQFPRRAFLDLTDHRLANHPLSFIFCNHTVPEHPVNLLSSHLRQITPHRVTGFPLAAPPDCVPCETRGSLALYRFCCIPNPEFLGRLRSIFTDCKRMNDR